MSYAALAARVRAPLARRRRATATVARPTRRPHSNDSDQPSGHLFRAHATPGLAPRLAALVLGSAVLAGCAPSDPPHIGRVIPQPSPISAEAGISDAPYRPVTAGYHHRRPVEPEPWRGRNEAVSPDRGDGS